MEQVKIVRRGISRPMIIALAVLVIVGAVCAWYVTRSDNNKTAEQTAITDADTMMDPAEYTKRIENPDATYKLVIKDHKIISGPTKITVKKGQSVNIDFSTPGDEVDLELEGYNIISETNNVQEASGGFHFIADKTGTFKFFIPGEEEEHAEGTDEPEHDIQLGTITVIQ